MFGLDADAAGSAPKVATTLTTRDLVPLKVLGEALAQTTRKVRAEVGPDAKYGGTLEWTTGQAKKSGGHRRPHLHLLWKGVEEAEAAAIANAAADVFTRLTGAHSHTAEGIRTPGAAIRYVALHHLKEAQAPPPGWSGRRLWTSLGFWSLGAAETRERARAVVKDERVRFRIERELVRELEETPGAIPLEIWDELVEGRAAAARKSWRGVVAVRVRERDVIDTTTGEVRRVLVEVDGDVR